MARTIAATSVAPLELVRTRRQAATNWPHRTVIQALVTICRTEGSGVLFRGLGPTLMRDVPFSAMYWFGVEDISMRLRQNPPSQLFLAEPTPSTELFDTWAIGFTAGATSGCFAALATTPVDVVKTKMQLDTRGGQNAWQTTRAIMRQEGASGFFAGVVPRVGKVAPACAIMISVFEFAKAAFAGHP